MSRFKFSVGRNYNPINMPGETFFYFTAHGLLAD